MEFTPGQLAALEAKANAWQRNVSDSFPYVSTASEWGWCVVVSVESGWNVALKVVEGADGAPSVQELRIIHGDNLAQNKDARAISDRYFWLDEGEEHLHSNEFLNLSTTLAPHAPDGGISTTLLRKIPWGDLFETAREGYGDYLAASGPGWAGLSDQAPQRKGGPDRGDLFYAQRAAEYLALVKEGERSPIETMATRHQYDRETVAGWIKQARGKRRLMVSAGRGRAGGTLTPRAIELLEGDRDE